MPTKLEIFEALKKELEERPEAKDERAFMGDVRKQQQERIANPKKRFTAECGSPEIYVSLNQSKDFVLDHVQNVTVAWNILAWAWSKLRDKEVLDELMAKGPH